MSFREDAERAAARWKATTVSSPDEAREPGPVRGRGAYAFCLPESFAYLNVLPDARPAAAWFADADIAWYGGLNAGPTNHLLSSQIQCLNALGPLAFDAAALRWFFGGVLDIAETVPVGTPEAPNALVSFEWIGDGNPLGEWRNGRGARGTRDTSVDAVIRYNTSHGDQELALIEWKYVEDYRAYRYDDRKLPLRLRNYRPFLEDPNSPIRTDIDQADLICEPIYQLMRLQLLAWRTELHDQSLSAVRLVVVAPGRNAGYHQAIPKRLSASASCPPTTVADLWQGLLSRPDRFAAIDSARLLTSEAPTSDEFKARYRHSDHAVTR